MQHKYNILHIIDHMGLGGAQTMVKGIFEAPTQSNHLVLYSLKTTQISTEVQGKHIYIHPSTSRFTFPLFALRKIIREQNIEILHCHLAKSQIMGWILKVCFFRKITLVFHEHGEIFENGKIYPFLMTLFHFQIDTFIAVSEETKRQLIEKTKFLESKIHVLYNFVNEQRFFPQSQNQINAYKKELGIGFEQYVVGFAARFIERKGWKEFLQAAKVLIGKGYNMHFLLAGDGPDKEQILYFIQKNHLENHITLLGYISQMPLFYSSLNCFAFTSIWEPMGLTGLEANACGTCVVASDIPGLNEVMKDNQNALLFEKQNIYSLTESIEKLYLDENLSKELKQHAGDMVQKYYVIYYLQDLQQFYENK